MTYFRAFFATGFFVVGIVSTVTLFKAPFEWMTLVVALACFVLAYLVWPSKSKGQRQDDYWPLDTMEILIELPADIIFWAFRMLGHLFRKGDGIDIDI